MDHKHTRQRALTITVDTIRCELRAQTDEVLIDWEPTNLTEAEATEIETIFQKAIPILNQIALALCPEATHAHHKPRPPKPTHDA